VIKKVKINPGCVSCGACQSVCGEVFEIKGISQVRPQADLNINEQEIKEAVKACPVGCIEVVREEK